MFIDTHAHMNLYMGIEQILKQAIENGVEKIISVGMSAISQKRVLKISEHYEEIYPALGIHPQEVAENNEIEDKLDSIIAFITENNDKLCAIAEIGLDHHFVKEKDLYPLQKRIFLRMLELAQDLKLPVNLHTKGAEKEIFDLLPSYSLPHINIHWYSGPEKFLNQGMERGYYFSFNPAIHYSKKIQNYAKQVDIHQILLESDGPVEYRGKSGTPALIRRVAQKISKIKDIEFADVEELIEENTRDVFSRIF
ncbi:MAG: TatD family hydrolase [Promethearchaeia archaeon]